MADEAGSPDSENLLRKYSGVIDMALNRSCRLVILPGKAFVHAGCPARTRSLRLSGLVPRGARSRRCAKAVPQQGAVKVGEQPFVHVEVVGRGQIQALQQRSILGTDASAPSPGGVHMKPHVVFGRCGTTGNAVSPTHQARIRSGQDVAVPGGGPSGLRRGCRPIWPIDVRSSTAPQLVVPTVPATKNGSRPAALSACIAAEFCGPANRGGRTGAQDALARSTLLGGSVSCGGCGCCAVYVPPTARRVSWCPC